jgi:LytS/YehU family sensor histidine kinase
MHIDKRLLTRMMPRLAIQMLVENAIKHGISRSVDPAELKVVMGYQKGHQEGQACHETYESH